MNFASIKNGIPAIAFSISLVPLASFTKRLAVVSSTASAPLEVPLAISPFPSACIDALSVPRSL